MVMHKIIRKQKRKEKEMRLLILGLDNAGKTTMVKKFKGEPTDTISPTLGFSIETLQYGNYRLNVWDIGGQKSLRAYWKNYFEETDGLIWVVDSADTRRMEDCKRELDDLLREEKIAGATLLVLANKQDLQGALSVEKIGELLHMHEIGKRHHNIFSCSAATGDGLVDAMQWLVDDISSRLYLLDH